MSLLHPILLLAETVGHPIDNLVGDIAQMTLRLADQRQPDGRCRLNGAGHAYFLLRRW